MLLPILFVMSFDVIQNFVRLWENVARLPELAYTELHPSVYVDFKGVAQV